MALLSAVVCASLVAPPPSPPQKVNHLNLNDESPETAAVFAKVAAN